MVFLAFHVYLRQPRSLSLGPLGTTMIQLRPFVMLFIMPPLALGVGLFFLRRILRSVRSPWHRAGLATFGFALLAGWCLVLTAFSYADYIQPDDQPTWWVEHLMGHLLLATLVAGGFSMLFFVTGFLAPLSPSDHTPHAL